jgi:uncharacterized protein YraI
VSPSSPARALPSTRLVRLLLAVLFVFVLAAPLVATPRTARAAGAYTTDYLNLRAGPSTENYIKLVMSPGSWVELLSDLGRSGFYKVAYRGELGYAHSDYLSFGGPAAIDAGWGNAGSARTTSALNLRAGPGLSYAVALVMPEGAGVQLTGSAESGFLGVIFDGLNGWASNEYLTPGDSGSDPGSGDGGTAYTTSALNLRAGPSVTNGVKLVMPYGAEVALSGEERNGFAGVRYDGTSGWASLDYLSSSPPGSDGGASTGTDIVSIIYAAAAAYGQSGDAMLAVAQCESLLNPNAYNSSSGASGLFQFLPGTWASTPWAGQDIFDPVANAQAAAWMWSVGRRGEWVC